MRGKLVILGTSSAVPTKDRNHSAVYLQFSSLAYLFDCGEGTQRQIQKANVSFFKINSIFITHLHGDHVLGLPGLLQTLDFHDKKEINIYGPPGIKKLVDLSTKECFYINTEDLKINTIEIEPADEEPVLIMENNDIRVYAISLNHSVISLGFRLEEKEKFKYQKEKIEKLKITPVEFQELKEKGFIPLDNKRKEILLKEKEIFKEREKIFQKGVIHKEDLGEYKKGFSFVYFGDTYYTENIHKLVKENDDFVILECTFLNENNYAEEMKHLSLDIFLKKIYPDFHNKRVKHIILTHFSRRYKDLKPFEEILKANRVENVLLAYDLMQFEF
jgi:ribonuclease Z